MSSSAYTLLVCSLHFAVRDVLSVGSPGEGDGHSCVPSFIGYVVAVYMGRALGILWWPVHKWPLESEHSVLKAR